MASGDKALIKEGRLSYPSGHAAYSHASGAVCFWWLAARLGLFGAVPVAPSSASLPTFARLLVALAPVGLATFIATTRLTDYVHHFSDVNAGSFIGMACGTACYHLHYTPGSLTGRAAAVVAAPTKTDTDGDAAASGDAEPTSRL